MRAYFSPVYSSVDNSIIGNSAVIQIINPQGIQGKQGIQGVTGLKGEQGLKGVQGISATINSQVKVTALLCNQMPTASIASTPGFNTLNNYTLSLGLPVPIQVQVKTLKVSALPFTYTLDMSVSLFVIINDASGGNINLQLPVTNVAPGVVMTVVTPPAAIGSSQIIIAASATASNIVFAVSANLVVNAAKGAKYQFVSDGMNWYQLI